MNNAYILECIDALQRVTKKHGYSKISIRTLKKVLASYVAIYSPPQEPGTAKRQKHVVPPPPVVKSNVVSLFAPRGKPKAPPSKPVDAKAAKERMKKDREAANKKVLRSYRLGKRDE